MSEDTNQHTNEQRSHETVIEIAAPAELVWKAISEADEIVRWFAPQAKVEPGPGGSMVGGTMWLSWGEGVEGTSRIEIWEPGKHLRTVTERHGAYDDCGHELPSDVGPVKVTVDYFIESHAAYKGDKYLKWPSKLLWIISLKVMAVRPF